MSENVGDFPCLGFHKKDAPGFGDLNARKAVGKMRFRMSCFSTFKTGRENTSKKRLSKKMEILVR